MDSSEAVPRPENVPEAAATKEDSSKHVVEGTTQEESGNVIGNGNGHGTVGEEPMDTTEPPEKAATAAEPASDHVTEPVEEPQEKSGEEQAIESAAEVPEPSEPAEPAEATPQSVPETEDDKPVDSMSIKTKGAMKDISDLDTTEKDDAQPKDAENPVDAGKSGDEGQETNKADAEVSEKKSVEPKDAFDAMLDDKKPAETEESASKESDEKSEEKPEKVDAFDTMLFGDKPKGDEAPKKEPEKLFTKVDSDSDHDAFDSAEVTVQGDAVPEETKKEGDVVTVEDDGKPIEPEEAWLKEIPNDDDYFGSLDNDELDWYKDHGPKVETAGDSGLKCTACSKNVTLIIGSHNGATRHCKLGVAICKPCKYFYKNGSGWEQDEEGLDKYCRWCGQGGEIMICDKCPCAFCKRCLQRNLGRAKVAEITKAEEWKCLVCEPKQIYEQRAFYHAIYQRYKSGNFKKPEVRKTPRKAKSEPVPKAKVEAIMKSPRNFVDENIHEAFKTLSVYQKCLEQERDRWIKNTKGMGVDNAVSTCRALRKIYAITKQNMDLLDKAIVQSFVEKYPKDSVKIHMGKVGVKVKEGSLTGKPVSVKGHTKVKLKVPAKKKAAPKRKVAPKKKKTAAAKRSRHEVVEMNGSPVYADPDDHDIFQVVRPSLSKKKIGPASRTKKKQMFTKKKAARYSSDEDSDVVTLSSDDERPKKPGPASRKRKSAGTTIASPPKKRRPGPRSRTH